MKENNIMKGCIALIVVTMIACIVSFSLENRKTQSHMSEVNIGD